MTAIDENGHASHEVRMAALKAFAMLAEWEFGEPEPTFSYTARVRVNPWERDTTLQTRATNISSALTRVKDCSDDVPTDTMALLWRLDIKPENKTYAACSQAALRRVAAFNAEHAMPGYSQMTEEERGAAWDAWAGEGSPYRAGI